MGAEAIFKYSDKTSRALIDLSTIVCRNELECGRIIDGLYFLFYENLKHIKTLVGNGNEKTGDSIIRNSVNFDCIFKIKAI